MKTNCKTCGKEVTYDGYLSTGNCDDCNNNATYAQQQKLLSATDSTETLIPYGYNNWVNSWIDTYNGLTVEIAQAYGSERREQLKNDRHRFMVLCQSLAR